MARKNSNAGQPNRVAQKNRRKQTITNNKAHQFRGVYCPSISGSRAVMGPLSEYLIPVSKPEGELVETTVIVAELVAA